MSACLRVGVCMPLRAPGCAEVLMAHCVCGAQMMNMARYEHFWELSVRGGQALKTFSNPFDHVSRWSSLPPLVCVLPPYSCPAFAVPGHEGGQRA